MAKKSWKTIMLENGEKYRMSEVQRYLLVQIVHGDNFFEVYDAGYKICCRSLERMGLVDRHPGGRVRLTSSGEQVVSQLDN